MPKEHLRTKFLTGIAVIVPMAVSAWVLITILRVLGTALNPIGAFLRRNGIQSSTTVVLLQGASLVILVALILLIGTVAQRRIGRRLFDQLDVFLGQIPGLGSIYQTARKMSDLVLNPDGEGAQFREVKLVEFPGQDTYTLGFLTSDSPPESVVVTARSIMDQPDAEYKTLFLPMAPNPVMGGHLTHVPADRVHDVDLEIEEAIQYILTTGVVDNTPQSSEDI